MKFLNLLLMVIISITACSYIGVSSPSVISPIQAIELSAESAPNKISGVFELEVLSINTEQRLSFLNSEIDNLVQRNLIIALRPKVVKELTDKYGVHPEIFFLGKNVRASGEAKRIKTWVIFKKKIPNSVIVRPKCL